MAVLLRMSDGWLTMERMTGEAQLGHPSAGTRVAGLDGLRGLAIAGVMLAHLHVWWLDAAGAVGVTVFFVLSGYLITTLLMQDVTRHGRVRLRRFYVRRARRLLPALAVVLAAVCVLTIATGVPLVTPLEVTGAAFYFHNFLPVLGGENPTGALHHTWSLSVEEQFYLVWPLVLMLFGTSRRVVRCLWVLVAVVMLRRAQLTITGASMERVLFGPDTRFDALMIGCLLAISLATGGRGRVNLGPALFLLVMLAIVPTALWQMFGLTLVALAAARLTRAVVSGAGPRVFEWRPLVVLGQVSYGLYLWHHVALTVSDRMLGNADSILLTAAFVLPVSAVLTWASWRFVEQPFLRQRSGAAADHHSGHRHKAVVGAGLGLDQLQVEAVASRKP